MIDNNDKRYWETYLVVFQINDKKHKEHVCFGYVLMKASCIDSAYFCGYDLACDTKTPAHCKSRLPWDFGDDDVQAIRVHVQEVTEEQAKFLVDTQIADFV
jgi:hypothetical protein